MEDDTKDHGLHPSKTGNKLSDVTRRALGTDQLSRAPSCSIVQRTRVSFLQQAVVQLGAVSKDE